MNPADRLAKAKSDLIKLDSGASWASGNSTNGIKIKQGCNWYQALHGLAPAVHM